MNKIVLLILSIVFFTFSAYCANDGEQNEMLRTSQQQEQHMRTYQQLKMEFIHLSPEANSRVPAPYATASKKDDKLMLYVAGGLVVASAALILFSNSNNYASNSATEVNTGIALGGGVAAGLFASKYFLDNTRPY
ncbi:MAG: hypothetical protein R6U66_00365 [Bacteroidales bacterium]